MSTVSVNAAAQLLRPPVGGLEYLRHDRAAELSLEPGSVTIEGELIARLAAAPDAELQVDAGGCAVIPGFVDCHTHLPFAGWRAREYAQKVAGESYQAIAAAGGGIRASARALEHGTDAELLAQSGALAAEMLAHGTTTFECKSGYGLSRDGELRALRLARELAGEVRQSTTATALLAHAIPEGYDADGWVDEVEAMLPEVLAVGGISALDVYVEDVAFGTEQLRRIGALAARYGLDLRAHVEQFTTMNSVPIAIEQRARSVDHLACLPTGQVATLARSQTAAVLLPGAEFLGDEHVAPARALADAGAICVLGSDLNPGTSPVGSMPLVIGLAVRRYRWSVQEALLACTLNAAWVLRLSDRLGSLEPGKRADLVLLDGPVQQIPYRLGHNPVAIVVVGGRIAHVRPDCAWRVSGMERGG